MAQLTVLSGPDVELMGKKYELMDNSTIGSDPEDAIILKDDDAIAPGHIRVNIKNGTIELVSKSDQATMSINGEDMTAGTLTHGDMLMLGEYMLMFDDEEGKDEPKRAPAEVYQSRIESRQKYYDSTKHIIDSLENTDKSQSRLITLYKISNAISGILELDLLLKKFLEIILEEFSADRGFIMLYDSIKGQLLPAAALSKSGEAIKPNISRRIAKEVITCKESLLCENIMDDDRFRAQESLITHEIHAAMCVPLIRNDELLGLIHVDSKRRSRFSKSDLDLLTKVAMQAAIVIENARFYETKQSFNHNLLALSEATQNISSYFRDDLVCKDSTKYATQILKGQKSFLFLKKQNILKIETCYGLEKKDVENLAIPTEIMEVFETGLPFIANKKMEFSRGLKEFSQNGTSFLAVPIATDLRYKTDKSFIIGVLCVANKEDDRFIVEDQQLLTILASYTAIALSNASYYKQIKKKEIEIEKWNSELERRVASRTDELEAIQDQLVQSEKMAAVGLLAAGVSHEFNNIIASMYGFAQIAKKNEKYKEKLVDIVIDQSKRASEITESLQSFSKQKGNTKELISIHDILEAVFNLINTALENEGIEVVKEYGDIPKIVIDSGKIQQVFLNIIINARHAIEKNGIITIRTLLSEDKKWLIIEFHDTGKGIEEENISKIFDPFYTTKGSFGGGTQPGTGIGLSLCYNIVSLHGGDIKVTSILGEGSCFTVTLPVKTEFPKKKEEFNKDKFLAKMQKQQRALIVEDDQNVREMLKNILLEKGFEIKEELSGVKIIELCKKERFDILFLNVMTDKFLEGINILEEIKRLEPTMKIILITGRAEQASLMSYVSYAHGYLRKPFNNDDIYMILKERAK